SSADQSTNDRHRFGSSNNNVSARTGFATSCNNISSSKNSAATIDVAPTYRSPNSGRKSRNASRCTLGDSDNTDTINESKSSIAASLITLRRAEYEPNKLDEIIISIHHTSISSSTSTPRTRLKVRYAIHKRTHSRTTLISSKTGNLLTGQPSRL